MSSHSDTENLNKESDERYQIDKGDQLYKRNGENVYEVLTSTDELLMLVIMSSQSFIERVSGEKYQRDNYDQIEKISENDE